jgi:hypothetical protein
MMRKKSAVAWTAPALVLAGLALAGMARANSRDFTCSYRVSDVNVSGDTASLTLTLRLINHSTVDISNATVVLRDSIIPSRNFGMIPNVNVPAGQAAQLSGTFQVPQREYQIWQQGKQPILMIEYADAAGNMVRRLIEIERTPVRPSVRPEARPENRPEAKPAVH